MLITFLYCIDYPEQSNKSEKADHVRGWLLCSHDFDTIILSDSLAGDHTFEYGLHRPDVKKHFKKFSDSDTCGFTITPVKGLINLKDEFVLNVKVITGNGSSRKISISLDLNSSGIQEIEVDDKKDSSDKIAKETEENFIKTLHRHPWITIRMDITNKCNLRCIMCHYKEKEIYSRPAKYITAEQLKSSLQDIAPYVKHIMLSCGFEPLMSKHFTEIVSMLHNNFPQMEIGLCTNAMLLESKARKAIIENNVSHVILSFDGVTKRTLEKIRAGADYSRILSNIMALHELKKKHNRTSPLLFMDFVLMNSNLHEAPAFVGMCAKLGIAMIDFRHLVGNIYFSEHEEIPDTKDGKYNYYRQRIIEESKKYNMDVRLPEAFDTTSAYIPDEQNAVSMTDFNNVIPDIQTEEIKPAKEVYYSSGKDADFAFLANASCLRPFSEIMITEDGKIMPCSYYSDAMGVLGDSNTLHSIFFNDTFRNVRRKKLLSRFDHNCMNCPIKLNLLPTEIVK